MMNYKVEISGGLAGTVRTLEGTLSDANKHLQKALLTEKNMLKINPNFRTGLLYKINLQSGKKKHEFIIDEPHLTTNQKQLIEIAMSA
tara:strand:+ start:196878 stop:197141 length:264 start_codon:yes stop_codon:yes gene_type:complete